MKNRTGIDSKLALTFIPQLALLATCVALPLAAVNAAPEVGTPPQAAPAPKRTMKQQVDSLENRFKLLEARIRQLEGELAKTRAELAAQNRRVAEAAKTAQAAQGQAAEDQEKALALLRGARGDVARGDADAARKKLAEIQEKYAHTKSARHAVQFSKEVDILGTEAGPLEVEKWYAGGSGSIDDGEVTVLVFWEVWCPHCKREVPKLQALYEKYRDRGLNLIGLTKVTKSATDERVESFISEHGLTYPTAKEKDGAMSRRYAVSGVPAAAVIKNGKIIWRGHPAQLQDAKVEQFLAASDG